MHRVDDVNDALDLVAAEFADRCRRGERPLIKDYAERHPELADDIRELFPTIVELETAKSDGLSSGAAPALTPSIERLGDFRVIREIGRGGMGVVFEAEQESLGRRVAIKVLPRLHLDDARRANRFRREAKTAGKLHHSNIVPIFGVGEDGGWPYFVMQYIQSIGLDRTFTTLTFSMRDAAGADVPARSLPELARLLVQSTPASDQAGRADPPPDASGDASSSEATEGRAATGAADSRDASAERGHLRLTYWRSLARAFAKAADAIDYAHSQGVLHRDIKPANLLLDAEGVLWVSDFGLAKALEQEGLTEDGDVIGTLRYMAPEQFSGQVDERVDVYGLGITLYELATLTPAFAHAERNRLMRAILHEEPTRPRKLVLRMPSDLETIILKAIARDRENRYAGAAALRDDLNRFADDLPITARRISSTERLWRWARRNPALAATTSMVFLLLATLAVVFSFAYAHVRIANDRTQAALETARQQRTRAEGTADLAIEALDAILAELAPVGSDATLELSVGGSDAYAVYVADPRLLTPGTVNLLEHLLGYYQRLARRGDESVVLDTKVAAAHRRVGQIYELFGRFDDAHEAYATAIEHYKAFLEADANDVSIRLALAEVHNQFGALLAVDTQLHDARDQFDRAGLVLAPILDQEAPDPRATFEAARTLYLAARRPGPAPGAGPGPGPEPRGVHRGRGRGYGRRGGRDRHHAGPRRRGRGGPFGLRRIGRGHGRESRRRLEQAVTMLNGLLDQAPVNPAYRHLLALCLRETHRPRAPYFDSSSIDNVDRAAALLEQLVADYPDVARYRLDLAETYAIQDYAPDAERRFEEALSIIDELVRQQPHAPAYRFARAHLYLRRFHALSRRGRLDEGIASMRRGLTELRGLLAEFPEVGGFAVGTTLIESRLAQLLVDRGDWEAARALLEPATTRLAGLIDDSDAQPRLRRFAGLCYNQLAVVYAELGARDKQQDAADRARELAQPPHAAPP